MTEAESLIPPGLDATLVLLRHGETTFIVEGRFQGRLPAPLSDLGVRQAELAARRLAEPGAPPALPVPAGPPLAVLHSPLVRTTQVATAVAAALRDASGGGLGPSLRAEPALTEIGQGAWEGLGHAEIRERYGDELAAWRRDPAAHHAPGGESLAEVQGRLRAGLRPVLAELAGAGRPGSLDRSQVLGYVDPRRAVSAADAPPWLILVGHDGCFKVLLLTLLDLPLERFWSFPFALCGISVVDIRGGRAALRAHNLVDHLAALDAASPPERRAQPETEARERSGAL
ncbi:MAG TPA: histidine phosphatase family protein [Candidatus Limnocylindrales bacterium]